MPIPAWITEMIDVQNEIEKKLTKLNLLVKPRQSYSFPQINDLIIFIATRDDDWQEVANFEPKWYMASNDGPIGDIVVTSLHGYKSTISLFESDHGFEWQTTDGSGVDQFIQGFIASLPQLDAIFR